MIVLDKSETICSITFDDGRKLTVVGTAHISQKSVDEVKEQIDLINPDSICIELDEDRWEKFHKKDDSYKDFDLIKIIKEGKFFFTMANIILGSFQKRLGKSISAVSGQEIVSAGDMAIEKNIPLCFADRNISITLKRSWAKSSLYSKAMILVNLLASAFDKTVISEEELEKLKTQHDIDKMLEELAKQMPSIKSVLIDERDLYLASKIFNAQGNNKFAVIGQGHKQGLIRNLEKLEKKEITSDVSELEKITKKKYGFLKDYFFPILICAGLVTVGILKGWKMGSQYFAAWALLNSVSAGFGALLGLAHPLTFLVTVVTSSVSALTPILGVGMIAAFVQANVSRSRVRDLENISDDLSSFKMWYKNRILHTFLIFIFTTLSSAIGTLVVFPIFKNFVFNLFGWG